MENRFTTLNIRIFRGAKKFTFTTTSGTVYNLSLYGRTGRTESLTSLCVDSIDGLLSNLNNRTQDPDEFNWIYGTFHSYKSGLPVGIVKILPVYDYTGIYGIEKSLIIIDTSFLPESATAAAESAIPAAAQPGGSLYDKKGKLLYRGEMKNGVPHGYGTGYYANGKVGHVGMFKGGKIVQ